MWLSGGPGVPSIKTALGQNGPCVVLEDSKTTEINPWSWNDKVNMIYIDQPVQVGYSYDALVNGTIELVASPFYYKPSNFSQSGVPETNLTFLTGTFASQNPANAPNTTMAAAPFIWQFMQTWMQEYVSPIDTYPILGTYATADFPNLTQPIIASASGASLMRDTGLLFLPITLSSKTTELQTVASWAPLYNSALTRLDLSTLVSTSIRK
jgi:hypothetical protein